MNRNTHETARANLLAVVASIMMILTLAKALPKKADKAPTTTATVIITEPVCLPSPTPKAIVDEPTAPQMDDAELIAKAWYGFGNYYSDVVLESFVDFVDNRVNAQLYGAESVEDVIFQPSQWQGWSEDNPVIESTYQKIKAIQQDRANGGHKSIPSDLMFFVCESKGITYRTAWEGGNTWYVGE